MDLFPPQCLCWLLVTRSKNSSLPPDPKYKSVALQTVIPHVHTFFLLLEQEFQSASKEKRANTCAVAKVLWLLDREQG